MHYIQVFIKSKDDLPKEEGDYFCCRLGFKTVQTFKFADQWWIKEVRWYLQPIDAETLITAIKIIRKELKSTKS
jgi:hypothetical protein